jgi:hypothetical protein
MARKGQRFVGEVLDLADNRIAQSDKFATGKGRRSLRFAPRRDLRGPLLADRVDSPEALSGAMGDRH